MAKAYRVTELSFIGGKLCPIGTIVYDVENPGSNLELHDGKKAKAAKAAPASGPAVVGPFKVIHKPVGNFVVVDSNGLQIGDVYLKEADSGAAKAKAQAAADQLNGSAEDAAEGAADDAAEEADGLPDA